ncbi:uncharacterized protein [Physcomitrium patens]|uniref:uncharacterized protein isoform X1 n=1 Tax=Physcomitrium patens TaxID=3218 RepID=UPI003CCCC349
MSCSATSSRSFSFSKTVLPEPCDDPTVLGMMWHLRGTPESLHSSAAVEPMSSVPTSRVSHLLHASASSDGAPCAGAGHVGSRELVPSTEDWTAAFERWYMGEIDFNDLPPLSH